MCRFSFTFLQRVLSNVSSNCLPEKRQSYIGCISLLLNIVCLQMSPQIGCKRRYIITLVAFVCLFSTVRVQMCPQIACIRGCKVTLVAFVWLFSIVCFQMCPQMACLWWCEVTLIAFIWIFSTLCFQICLKFVGLFHFLFLECINLYKLPKRVNFHIAIFMGEIFIHHFSRCVVPCSANFKLKETSFGIFNEKQSKQWKWKCMQDNSNSSERERKHSNFEVLKSSQSQFWSETLFTCFVKLSSFSSSSPSSSSSVYSIARL